MSVKKPKRCITVQVCDQLFTWSKKHPHRLFLVDGTGALVSAFLLGIVLVRYEAFFGIPPSVLYVLAVIPIGFAIYDVYWFIKLTDRPRKPLRRIAYANLLYCLFSLALALAHHEVIRTFGWVYILSEVAIVGGLAFLELKVAKVYQVQYLA